MRYSPSTPLLYYSARRIFRVLGHPSIKSWPELEVLHHWVDNTDNVRVRRPEWSPGLGLHTALLDAMRAAAPSWAAGHVPQVRACGWVGVAVSLEMGLGLPRPAGRHAGGCAQLGSRAHAAGEGVCVCFVFTPCTVQYGYGMSGSARCGYRGEGLAMWYGAGRDAGGRTQLGSRARAAGGLVPVFVVRSADEPAREKYWCFRWHGGMTKDQGTLRVIGKAGRSRCCSGEAWAVGHTGFWSRCRCKRAADERVGPWGLGKR